MEGKKHFAGMKFLSRLLANSFGLRGKKSCYNHYSLSSITEQNPAVENPFPGKTFFDPAAPTDLKLTGQTEKLLRNRDGLR